MKRYIPDGCPLFLQFLDEITAGDKELQAFLQRSACASRGCGCAHRRGPHERVRDADFCADVGCCRVRPYRPYARVRSISVNPTTPYTVADFCGFTAAARRAGRSHGHD
jgi:hypothetical protein